VDSENIGTLDKYVRKVPKLEVLVDGTSSKSPKGRFPTRWSRHRTKKVKIPGAIPPTELLGSQKVPKMSQNPGIPRFPDLSQVQKSQKVEKRSKNPLFEVSELPFLHTKAWKKRSKKGQKTPFLVKIGHILTDFSRCHRISRSNFGKGVD